MTNIEIEQHHLNELQGALDALTKNNTPATFVYIAECLGLTKQRATHKFMKFKDIIEKQNYDVKGKLFDERIKKVFPKGIPENIYMKEFMQRIDLPFVNASSSFMKDYLLQKYDFAFSKTSPAKKASTTEILERIKKLKTADLTPVQIKNAVGANDMNYAAFRSILIYNDIPYLKRESMVEYWRKRKASNS
ncbi:MAG TPA: hypothetical protein VM577_03700 [Anaerovoracaceae bacterium]|nr:hypothetical protein [Anaerovoracaceae bacterium]